MTELFTLLKDGGAIGALVIALSVVAYLYRRVEKQADAGAFENKRLTEALEKEKDEHRATAMTIVGLSQDLARLLERMNRRRNHGARREPPPDADTDGGDF